MACEDPAGDRSFSLFSQQLESLNVSFWWRIVIQKGLFMKRVNEMKLYFQFKRASDYR